MNTELPADLNSHQSMQAAPFAVREAESDARRYFSDLVGAHGAFSDASLALDRRAKEARSRMAAQEYRAYRAHLAGYALEVAE